VNAASAVPTWRLTRVGGDFIGWRYDGSNRERPSPKSTFRAMPASTIHCSVR
jgi:hypothetical protein